MSNRVDQVKLREARAAAESNLNMAIKHPKFEAKFLTQAAKAEQQVVKLERRLA